MKITTLHKNDVNALSHLQPEGWADIIPQFDFHIQTSFCFPIKVIVDQHIAGVGNTVVHNDVAWLGHIIVDTGYRCRGIGQRIVEILIDIAKQNNCSTIYLIATELGEPLYRKAGFITETEYLVHKNIERKEWAISGNIYSYEEKYKKHFTLFDREISGEDRMEHLEAYLNDSFIYRTNNMVEGYYLPTLGEGLIMANTDTAGIELLKLHLKTKDRVVIPQENRFLQQIGCGEVKSLKRMRWGKERKIQFSCIYNRISGDFG